MPGQGTTRSARELARETLLDRILTGVIPPGDTLSPAELAKELGVSATPLREALIELTWDGFLEHRPAHGFAVRHLSAQEAQDLYPLVWTLETLALKSAPPGADRLAALVRLNARIRKAADPRAAQHLDAEWHALLIGGCPNATLLATVASFKRRIYRYEDAYMRYSSEKPRSVGQHAAIVAALRRGRVAEAARMLRANWQIGPDFLVPWLERVTVPPRRSPQRPAAGMR